MSYNPFLDSMTNMFGRVRRSELRLFAAKEGESRFFETIRAPLLVGSGRLCGDFIEKEQQEGPEGTLVFRHKGEEDSLDLETQIPGEGVHEVIYPLMVDVARISGMQSFSLGRASENDLVIPDYSISVQHAKIEYDKRIYSLKDLRSTNGTSINGVSLEVGSSVELQDGDTLKFGRFQFIFMSPQALFRQLFSTIESREPGKPTELKDLTNALGRLDFISLKEFCRSCSKDEFKKIIRYPILVGSSLLPGEAWKVKDDEDETVLFKRFSDEKGQAREMKILARALFPLSKHPHSKTSDTTFCIGRSKHMDLRVDDPIVSKYHAKIEVRERHFFLTDNGSSNGTLVNGVTLLPFKPKRIRVADTLGFGRHQFVFLAPETIYDRLQSP